MASISNDGNGLRRILFARPRDGKRVAIRLGHMRMKDAKEIKAGIEALVSCAIAGTSMADETSRWVGTVGDALHASLAEHGLISARRRIQLGAFLDRYAKERKDVKAGTSINYRTSKKRLLSFFESTRYLHEITSGDADAWLVHLRSQGYAQATIGKTVKHARQFFRAAVRMGLLPSNVFEDLKAPGQTNDERLFFVSQEATQRAITAAPDLEWRLLIALSRYGGLRCPSEHLVLTWADVNWELQRFRVDAPKTGERWVPIFPELRPFLQEAFEAAEPGSEFIIQRYREANCNLRTQFARILRRAGVSPWPRLFQNLRSSRETELCDTFPLHVVAKWIGNTPKVAAAHYLQVTDEHFRKGAEGDVVEKAAQKAAHPLAEFEGIPGNVENANMEETVVFTAKSENLAGGRMTPTGFEPVSRP